MMKIGLCRLIGTIALVAPQIQGYAALAQIEHAGATAPALAE
jgi:hypothetical protein